MSTKPTPLDRAIEICGGQTGLGRKIGASQQLVAYWQKVRKGRVPAEFARDIELAVDGQVTRKDLRPDLFGDAA